MGIERRHVHVPTRAFGSSFVRARVCDCRRTSAFHFHCSEELGQLLPLESGDDAAAVMWLDIDGMNPKYATLYASHREFVELAADKLFARESSATRASREEGSSQESLLSGNTEAG